MAKQWNDLPARPESVSERKVPERATTPAAWLKGVVLPLPGEPVHVAASSIGLVKHHKDGTHTAVIDNGTLHGLQVRLDAGEWERLNL